MNIELCKFSTVISGYAFRGAIESDSKGNVLVVQAKNISASDPIVDIYPLTRAMFDVSGYAGYLQKNDVLIVARGMKSGAFRATVFFTDEMNVIASSSVYIIRIKDKNILSEYVAYYLNSTNGQDALADVISGSYIGALPRKELEGMAIPLPSLQKQQAIVNVHKNILAQQKILDRRRQINSNITNAIFKV